MGEACELNPENPQTIPLHGLMRWGCLSCLKCEVDFYNTNHPLQPLDGTLKQKEGLCLLPHLRELLKKRRVMVPRSFLLFIYVPSSITNPNGLSLISKLILTRSAASRKGHRILNEVGSIDLALKSLHDHIKNNDVRVGVKMASQGMKTLDSSIERLEAGLDGLTDQEQTFPS
ncbi:hypothetical protein RJ639_024277 [Escallonia herrerae]|uniref:Uncharacterized protein n=1 Tax=Escallonia herrerae TaxID=1293975 RepID=A0AA89ADI4_9ASTE|nr:hypothetical protein RJ639_024277 [Escallonia herrerae]